MKVMILLLVMSTGAQTANLVLLCKSAMERDGFTVGDIVKYALQLVQTLDGVSTVF